RLECPSDPPRPMTAEFAEALLLHDWPMNVRELQRLARRLVTLVERQDAFTLEVLPETMQGPLLARDASPAPRASKPPPPKGGSPDVEAPDREALEAVLRDAKGNVRRASAALSVHRTQLYRWLQRLDLDPDDYR